MYAKMVKFKNRNHKGRILSLEKQEVYNLLMKQLKNSSITIDEPMKQHTNFKIGGNADIYVVAKTVEDIKQVSKFAKENAIPLTIIVILFSVTSLLAILILGFVLST